MQLELREPLRKSTKNKKDHIRSIIMSVRETCAGQKCANTVHQLLLGLIACDLTFENDTEMD